MSDQQQQKPSPFDQQMVDPKFQSLSYDDQKTERAKLYDKLMSNDPKWASTPADQQIQAFNAVRDGKPPAFIDPKYEKLRQTLEVDSGKRFFYDTGTQMGLTGLATRGLANMTKGIGSNPDGVSAKLDRLFGSTVQDETNDQLFARAIAGDKDGVKLAKYLQGKYEKPILKGIPLIGGSTPTQMLGSALGYGSDFAMVRGPAKLAEEGIAASVESLRPLAQKALTLAGSAVTTGTMGVVRGAIAAGTNAIGGAAKEGVEGAIDFAHGLGETVRSVASAWGQWAAQDLAFGILKTGVGVGISRVLGTSIRSIFGAGTRALPNPKSFEETSGGVYTPRAEAYQRKFVAGVTADVAVDQLKPIARDWFRSYKEVTQYSKVDPDALINNPVAAMRTRAQFFTGENAPLGVSTVSDGPGTWRLRRSLDKGGAIIGEHLTLPEAEKAIYNEGLLDVSATKDRLAKWTARQEKTGGSEAVREVGSSQTRLNGLESDPLFRTMRDSQTIITGGMDRIAPEGAAKLPHEGSMLTYGEVGALQGSRMNVAKVQFDLSNTVMADIAKRGVLAPTDMPTRIPTTSSVTSTERSSIPRRHLRMSFRRQFSVSRRQEILKHPPNTLHTLTFAVRDLMQ